MEKGSERGRTRAKTEHVAACHAIVYNYTVSLKVYLGMAVGPGVYRFGFRC